MSEKKREYYIRSLEEILESDLIKITHEAYFTEGAIKDLLELLKGEPERLTDDDFETIRIHLNAQKEKLCNQQRWEEAEEYQRIIDRFMAFASAQPEIIRCGQCKYAEAADSEDSQDGYTCQFHRGSIWFSGSYCSWAERRGEEE